MFNGFLIFLLKYLCDKDIFFVKNLQKKKNTIIFAKRFLT